MDSASVAALRDKLQEIRDLEDVAGLLGWDEETHMAPAARAERGRQNGLLQTLHHARLTDPALGELLERARADAPDEADRRMAERFLPRHRRAMRLPADLVKAQAEARSAALGAWQTARAEDRFAPLLAPLTEVVRLARAEAEAVVDAGQDPYEGLLSVYEPDLAAADLDRRMAALREGLVPLIDPIIERAPPPAAFVKASYADDEQWRFTLRLLRDMGFDFDRGRQDRSAHPFTQTVAADDVRLTTRIHAGQLFSAIFSTIHEGGHGLYEQGLGGPRRGVYLAEAPGMGIHESQSRLWENMVGRSRAFWSHYLPVLKDAFPTQLEDVSLDVFYGAVNRVARSPIRVEADEVTYNLHIIVRYELERALIAGDLAVADLPAAFDEKLQAVVGYRPATANEGCQQDIHWPCGLFGYFPSYSLGNLYAAELMRAFSAAHPTFWDEVAAGRFQSLLDWLRRHVHDAGNLRAADDIVSTATGHPPGSEAFLAYLSQKYLRD